MHAQSKGSNYLAFVFNNCTGLERKRSKKYYTLNKKIANWRYKYSTNCHQQREKNMVFLREIITC